MKKIIVLMCTLAILSISSVSSAEISTSEAERLGKDLTPIGAEKAGNADGAIPAWEGGLTEPFPGWPTKDFHRPNPYADDKILFTITKDNMAQYADKLTPGTMEMFKAYPEAFKMNVYPARRTAAYPQWFYDAVKNQATSARLINDGNGVSDVWGAIPFPIPKNGNEMIWNHLLRFQGRYREMIGMESIVYTNGSRIDSWLDVKIHHTFYDPDVKDKYFGEGTSMMYASLVLKPARDAGEGVLAHENINPADNPRKAWQYDPGERRVRRAPNLAFDTPDRPINVIDDYEIFSGSPERYNWKISGKKEIYIPYNNNEIQSPELPLEDMTPVGYLNYNKLRYELHRVWVLEATLKEDKRHVYAKRVNYIDEDTWNIVAADKYDGNGNLWRISYSYPVVAPEIPVTGAGFYTVIDLKKNGYYFVFATMGQGNSGWNFEADPPDADYYTPAALRRRGR